MAEDKKPIKIDVYRSIPFNILVKEYIKVCQKLSGNSESNEKFSSEQWISDMVKCFELNKAIVAQLETHDVYAKYVNHYRYEHLDNILGLIGEKTN